jgi:hypothetical protein
LAAQYLVFAEGYFVKDGRNTDTYGSIKRSLVRLCESYGRTEARAFGPLALMAIQNRLVAEGNGARCPGYSASKIVRASEIAPALSPIAERSLD